MDRGKGMEPKAKHTHRAAEPQASLESVAPGGTNQPAVGGPSLVKKLAAEDNLIMKKTMIIIYVVLIALGVGTGYVLAGGVPGLSTTPLAEEKVGSRVQTDKVVGISDSQTFKDSADGVIEVQDESSGEGTHRLIREGGPSQTAHLISSVIDLDEYVGKKVKVWGQTMAAQKVSWLMDVGKIELLE